MNFSCTHDTKERLEKHVSTNTLGVDITHEKRALEKTCEHVHRGCGFYMEYLLTLHVNGKWQMENYDVSIRGCVQLHAFFCENVHDVLHRLRLKKLYGKFNGLLGVELIFEHANEIST